MPFSYRNTKEVLKTKSIFGLHSIMHLSNTHSVKHLRGSGDHQQSISKGAWSYLFVRKLASRISLSGDLFVKHVKLAIHCTLKTGPSWGKLMGIKSENELVMDVVYAMFHSVKKGVAGLNFIREEESRVLFKRSMIEIEHSLPIFLCQDAKSATRALSWGDTILSH